MAFIRNEERTEHHTRTTTTRYATCDTCGKKIENMVQCCACGADCCEDHMGWFSINQQPAAFQKLDPYCLINKSVLCQKCLLTKPIYRLAYERYARSVDAGEKSRIGMFEKLKKALAECGIDPKGGK